MLMRCTSRKMFILMALTALMSLALAQDLPANETINATAAVVVPEGPADVQGIWKVSLAGTEITMALNQSGDSLFGLAKFEGTEPWNGAVAGSISGRTVHLAMGTMQTDAVVATYLSSTLEGDTMRGVYVRSDSNGSAARGELDATMIAKDTSGYTPAVVEAVSQTAAPEQSQTPVAQAAVQDKTSPFKDVRNLAKGIDPNILPSMAPL